ncbi:unnamed protein product [Lota lota]
MKLGLVSFILLYLATWIDNAHIKNNGPDAVRICADPKSNWTERAVLKVTADSLAALHPSEDKAGGAGGAPTEEPAELRRSPPDRSRDESVQRGSWANRATSG